MHSFDSGFQEAWGWVFSYFLMTHLAPPAPTSSLAILAIAFYLSHALLAALVYLFKPAYNFTQGNTKGTALSEVYPENAEAIPQFLDLPCIVPN